MKTTDQMFLYLQNKNKNVIQNSILFIHDNTEFLFELYLISFDPNYY